MRTKIAHPPYTDEELGLETWTEKLLYRFILEKKKRISELQTQVSHALLGGFSLGLASGVVVAAAIRHFLA